MTNTPFSLVSVQVMLSVVGRLAKVVGVNHFVRRDMEEV